MKCEQQSYFIFYFELPQKKHMMCPHTYSQVAALILPICDPAMFTTVNFVYGNVFDIARRAKSAWLLVLQPLAFLRIQDGSFGHVEFRPIFKV
jgi:hypothetical protein